MESSTPRVDRPHHDRTLSLNHACLPAHLPPHPHADPSDWNKEKKKMLMFLALAVMLRLAQMAMGEEYSATGVAALRESKLNNYDKMVLPSGTTTVNISEITVLSFELHETEHLINVHTWLNHEWMDPRLEWSAEDHPGVEFLRMDPREIWKPDLTVYNSADVKDYMSEHLTSILVYPEGRVLYVPPVKIRFTCTMDLTYWPHDTHECRVSIGSWVHHKKQIDLQVGSDALKFNVSSGSVNLGMESISEWEVHSSKVLLEDNTYPCCKDVYPNVMISLMVCRKASAFTWTVKIPAVCLSILTLVLFLLPPDAGEKMTFGGLCLILNVLFIAYTTHVVSYAPAHTPLIVQMVSQQLVLMVVVVVVEALVVRMARSPRSSQLPGFVRQPVFTASYFLCLSNYKDGVTSSKKDHGFAEKTDEVELGEGSKGDLLRRESRHQSEWLLLAAILDRLAFFLCMIICLVILIRFSSVL